MSGTALSDVDFSPKINYPDAEVRDLTWQDAEEALRYATELLRSRSFTCEAITTQ